MEPLLLHFDLPSLDEQTVTDPKVSDIILYDDRIEYKLQMTCNEYDDKLGVWDKDVEQDDEVMFLKKFVAGVASSWSHVDKIWKVIIYMSGAKDTALFFNEELDCKIVAKSIREWLSR